MNRLDEIKNKAAILKSTREKIDPGDYCKQLELLLNDALSMVDKSMPNDISWRLTKGLVNNSLSGIHVYHLDDTSDDRSLRMIYANPMTEILTGVKCKDVIGKTLDENFPGLRQKGIPQAYAEVVRTGIPFEAEDIYYADDRVIAGAFLVKAFPLPHNHVGVSFENIIELKKFQQRIEEDKLRLKEQNEEYLSVNEELKETNERLHDTLTELERSEASNRELIENIKYGVAVYEAFNDGEDFLIKSVNKGVETIEKVKRDEIVGKKVTEIFPGVRDFGIFDILFEVYKNGKSKNFPLKYYKDNRIEGWRDNYIFRLPNYNVVAVYEDLTLQKSIENKIAQNEKILKHIQEYTSAFTGEEYFESVVTKLTETAGTDIALIGQFDIDNNLEIISSSNKEYFKKEEKYNILNCPCNTFVTEKKCKYISLQSNECEFLSHVKNKIFSGCMGIPLFDSKKNVKGIILGLFVSPPQDPKFIKNIFQLFSMRAGPELERRKYEINFLQNEQLLKQQNEEYLAINEELKERNEKIEVFNEILKQNEAYQNSIFKSAPVGIGVVKNRDFTFVNKLFCEMTGYTTEELMGNSSRIVYPSDEEFNRVGELKYRQIIEMGSGTIETIFKTKKGELIDVLLSSTPIDINDWSKGITFSALDITQRKKAVEDLNRIFELSVDLISIASLDGYFRRINPAFKKLLGYEDEELLNQPFFNFIHPDDVELTKQIVEEKLKKNQRVINFYNRYRCKNGTYVWLSWASQPVPEDNIIYAIAHDITEIKNNQQELNEYREKLEEAQAVGKIGHYNFDIISGTWTNSKMLDQIFGIDKEFKRTIEGWSQIIHPDYRDNMIKYLTDEVIGKNKKFDTEYKIINLKTGKERWVHGKGNLKNDKNGKVENMFGTIQDITDRKLTEFKILENEKALKEKNEEYQALNEELLITNNRLNITNKELLVAKMKAEESDKLKTAFLANMSHEIRTPMNGIIGFANLLTNDDLTPEKKDHYTDIINVSANQLLTIISDIIDISKIEAGQIDVIIKKFNINPIILGLQEQFESEKLKKGKEDIKIICEVSDEDHEIYSDEIRFKQIFSNLLSNSLKFTHKGYIKFGYYFNDDEEIIFFVEDSGIGISKENLDVIFERFRQEEDSGSREYGGTGLGLTISRALVEKLEGKIWVESVKGMGTKFFFKLKTNNSKPKEKETTDKKETGSENIPDNEHNWPDKKILIVEDMEIARLLLNEIIGPTKAQMIITHSGTEAIKLCEQFDPDIILMDIQLPDLNGYDVIREIRRFNKKTPIIVQTAFAMSGDDIKAYKAGCDGYISKPFTSEKILNILKKHINKI